MAPPLESNSGPPNLAENLPGTESTAAAPESAPADGPAAEDSQAAAADGRNSAADRDLAPFRDVPLELGVQLDRRRISVREVLALDAGSLLRLDRSTGENVDLLLNGALAGGGEIVVIDDMVGLRITDIYSDESRWGGAWRRPGR